MQSERRSIIKEKIHRKISTPWSISIFSKNFQDPFKLHREYNFSKRSPELVHNFLYSFKRWQDSFKFHRKYNFPQIHNFSNLSYSKDHGIRRGIIKWAKQGLKDIDRVRWRFIGIDVSMPIGHGCEFPFLEFFVQFSPTQPWVFEALDNVRVLVATYEDARG